MQDPQENGREDRYPLAAQATTADPTVPPVGGPGSDELKRNAGDSSSDRAVSTTGTESPSIGAHAGPCRRVGGVL